MTKLNILLTVMIVIGCTRETANSTESAKTPVESIKAEDEDSLRDANTDKIKFSDYVERIPQIDLPLIFSCDSGLVWLKIDYENNVIKKYTPEGVMVRQAPYSKTMCI